MVSTRSQSVLSADGHARDVGGEVNSSGVAYTPRRSGRLRSGGAAAATPTEQAPPASTVGCTTARARHPLKAIAEEPAAAAAAASEEEDEQQAASPAASEQASGSDEEEGEGEAAGSGQPLRADEGVVELLAKEMFAALDAAFGQQRDQQGADGDSGSESGSESSDSEGEGGGERYAVPSHLRWRPDLTLPGMGKQHQHQQQQHRGSSAAAGAAAAPQVHAVRGAAGGLHVPPVDARVQHKAARKAAPDTAGKGWFDLPATQITEEVKADLRMLRLRGALDPKAHYKKADATAFPKYFQMGTVVEGAADFYSGRLTNKQRKRTLTEEIMADEHLTGVRKKRFARMQEEAGKWSKKKTGRKTSNERRPRAKHRAKH